MNYLIDIDNIVTKENEKIYDFLLEMYPDIKQLYYKLWFLENIYKANKIVKEYHIRRINEEIDDKLKLYNIPKKILFLKNNREFLEPVTGTTFNLIKITKKYKINEEQASQYRLNVNKDYLNEVIPKYKKKILTN